MVKTMKIEGMMCGHCEAAVKKALRRLTASSPPRSTLTAPRVVTSASRSITPHSKKAVEDKDYTVTDIEG